jgi:hypothetical protein
MNCDASAVTVIKKKLACPIMTAVALCSKRFSVSVF